MPEKRPITDIVHGVPPVAVTTESTLVNRTGSWKYIRPIYQDMVAPCNAGCPVGIDIEGYMNLLREGHVAEAHDLLLRENPMPAVTGRVCEHPCQKVCSRASFDGAVSIRAVERMLGDLEVEVPLAPAPQRTRKQKVAVVGSGPAGLACAYHLARLGYAAQVYEADSEPGGALRSFIPEYLLPQGVLAREIEHIRSQGVSIRCNARIGGNVPWKEIEGYDAVFLATGARESLPHDLGGEELPDVRPGLEFLDEIKRGERGNLGRQVVVLGGTDTAVDCARTAVRLGAEATVVCCRAQADMPANPEGVEEAVREGVRFEFMASGVRVRTAQHPEGEEALEAVRSMFTEAPGGRPRRRLVGVECVRMEPGEADASGARRPVPVEGSGFVVPADTLFTALGEEPDFGFLPPDITRKGYMIKVDEFGHTNRAGFFAGGDITGERRTVAHSLGSGKRAAIGIDRYLRTRAGETLPPEDPAALRYGRTGNFSVTRWRQDDPVERTNEANEVVALESLNLFHFARVKGQPDRYRALEDRRAGFGEANLGLTREEALAEARRCFNCGVCNECEVCLVFCPDVAIKRHGRGKGFSLSYKYCKGCGICVEECPRGAMSMTREGL